MYSGFANEMEQKQQNERENAENRAILTVQGFRFSHLLFFSSKSCSRKKQEKQAERKVIEIEEKKLIPSRGKRELAALDIATLD